MRFTILCPNEGERRRVVSALLAHGCQWKDVPWSTQEMDRKAPFRAGRNNIDVNGGVIAVCGTQSNVKSITVEEFLQIPFTKPMKIDEFWASFKPGIVQIGCQKFTNKKILELAKIIKRMGASK